MIWIIVLVFVGVFAFAALVMSVVGAGASEDAKQVHATLDSALATESLELREQIIDLRKTEQLSSIPWLDRRLLRNELAPRLQKWINQADLKWTAGALLGGSLLLFLLPAYLIYLRLHVALVALACGALLGSAPFGWINFKRNKRLDKFQEGLPEALDMIVSSLRAGQSFIASMGAVARECADPLGYEFRVCFEEQNYGLELKVALDNLINRVPLQDLRIVSTAIMIQKETGGNLAEVLDKTSHVIRERFRLKRQVRTHTAQGRMTGWILTLLPVVLGIILTMINHKMMSTLWTTPKGILALKVASGMLVVGGLVIRKIVNLDV